MMDLKRVTPLGCFCCEMSQELEEADGNDKFPAAHSTLSWFADLTKMFPQDTAAVFVLCPEQEFSALGCMSVLQMEAFKVQFLACV